MVRDEAREVLLQFCWAGACCCCCVAFSVAACCGGGGGIISLTLIRLNLCLSLSATSLCFGLPLFAGAGSGGRTGILVIPIDCCHAKTWAWRSWAARRASRFFLDAASLAFFLSLFLAISSSSISLSPSKNLLGNLEALPFAETLGEGKGAIDRLFGLVPFTKDISYTERLKQ